MFNLQKINRLVDFCHDQGFGAISCCTNLTYKLTDPILNTMQKMYDDKGQSYIETSWDHKIRFNEKQLQLWTKNIQTLLQNNIIPEVSITLTKQLLNDFTPEQIYAKFTALGVRHIQFERLLVCGSACNHNLVPSADTLTEWLANAAAACPDNITVKYFGEIKDGLQGNCHGCIGRLCYNNQFTIDVDGTIYGCPVDYIHKRGSIFTSLKQNKTQLNLINCVPDVCLNCQYVNVCKGDCYLINDRCTIKPLFDVINNQIN